MPRDPTLRGYAALIIDEAHERSLNIDFVLGILKKLVHKRRNLKLIITSATIDPERFSRHFDDAPIVEVSGRTYPVEIRYRPLIGEDEDSRDLTLLEGIVQAADELEAVHGTGAGRRRPRGSASWSATSARCSPTSLPTAASLPSSGVS